LTPTAQPATNAWISTHIHRPFSFVHLHRGAASKSLLTTTAPLRDHGFYII
jgi:hypothetical protein